MEASEKSPAIEQFLSDMIGQSRVETIESDRCVPAPIGCGGDASAFRDALSRKEYSISGLCQKCQDEIFGSDEDSNDESNIYY